MRAVESRSKVQCFVCEGEAIEQTVSELYETERGILRIEGIPAVVCQDCGEAIFGLEVVGRLGQLRDLFETGELTAEPTPAWTVRFAQL